jgi:predicted transcriptional regulator
MIVVADVLKTISDSRSLELFRIVALTKPDTDMLISKTRLTRKQYYLRISRLMKAGLIKRRNWRHTLTAFGMVVYDTQIKIENEVNNYWNLKALDSIEDSNDSLPQGRKKFIYDLVEDQEIRDILVTDKDNKCTDNNNKLESDQHFIDIELQKYSINQN